MTLSTEQEQELIKRCIDGVSSAQTQLYQLFSAKLFSICCRYASSDDQAKDMFQESFIRIFQKLPDFRFEGSFEGWLKRITVNQCLDAIRKDKSKLFDDLEDNESVEVQFNTAADQLQANDLLVLLSKLPLGYRTVFNLYAIEGFSHQEIAGTLGISESTSKTQLFKARKWLQQRLKND
ncbi:MAG: RNA polymerase sigma factor [Bacteroidia bacterium]|nr:RNA polymerase sigma factor [Bacteroidia bacterium]